MPHNVQPDASRLERLMLVRDQLSAVLAGEVPARDRAAVSREYRAVLAEIDELAPPTQKGDAVDEITRRREARRQAAPRSSRTKRPR